MRGSGLKAAEYVLLGVVCAAAAGNYPAGNSPDERSAATFVDGMMCGPECLWLVTQRCGKNVSLETLVRMARVDPHVGMTVDNMVRVCREMRLSARVVKTDLESLLADPRQDILLVLNNTHFVLLLGADDNSVYVVDKRRRRRIDAAAFSRYWDGLAITVGPVSTTDTWWFPLSLLMLAALAATAWGSRHFSRRLRVS